MAAFQITHLPNPGRGGTPSTRILKHLAWGIPRDRLGHLLIANCYLLDFKDLFTSPLEAASLCPISHGETTNLKFTSDVAKIDEPEAHGFDSQNVDYYLGGLTRCEMGLF